MNFSWDLRKAAANLAKHGVAFAEAATVFIDPYAATYPDPDHSHGESRWITIGYSSGDRCLVVIHVDEEDETIRIVSTRRATPKERHAHSEES